MNYEITWIDSETNYFSVSEFPNTIFNSFLQIECFPTYHRFPVEVCTRQFEGYGVIVLENSNLVITYETDQSFSLFEINSENLVDNDAYFHITCYSQIRFHMLEI